MAKQIELPDGSTVLVDDEDYEGLSAHNWHKHGRDEWPYAARYRKQDDPDGPKRVYMHRSILGISDPDVSVHHINGDGLDNRKSNLRRATTRQNSRKRKGLLSINTSGFMGVTENKSRGVFEAKIRTDDGRKWLGYFPTAIEAALAYNVASIKEHGEFATVNNIPDGEGVLA